MFWYVLAGLAVVYVVQTVLALRQSKNYTSTYAAMRRRGRVAIGKKKGLLTTGAIVMFLIDEVGTVVEGVRITGVTVMARFKPFPVYDGSPITTLDATGDRRLTGSMRGAVNNARDNYLMSVAGIAPPEPPGPLTQIVDRFRALIGRPRPATAAVPAPPKDGLPVAATQASPHRRQIPVPVRK